MTRFEHVGNCQIVKLVLEGELTEILYAFIYEMQSDNNVTGYSIMSTYWYYLNSTGVTLKLWMVTIIQQMLVHFINFMLPVNKYCS